MELMGKQYAIAKFIDNDDLFEDKDYEVETSSTSEESVNSEINDKTLTSDANIEMAIDTSENTWTNINNNNNCELNSFREASTLNPNIDLSSIKDPLDVFSYFITDDVHCTAVANNL
ncbi:hypothetical protein FQA39_LY03539 [Lamprigera yunnana]|nr:hypothetical protein FQA39_LY03539 [Lamprigera yunnana]